MSMFSLTAQEINAAITELTSSNGQFKQRINDLCSKQQELATQWQGDANTAFNNAFQRDKGQWDAFSQLIDRYVDTLTTILKTYETVEATNTQTATTRTY